MKISEIHSTHTTQRQEKPNQQGNAEIDFQEMMARAKREADLRAKPPEGVSGPPMFEGVSILQNTQQSDSANQGFQSPLYEELNQTVDLMEFLATKLADASVSSHKMEALIGHLEDRFSTLKRLESDANLSPRLRPLISDVAMTIGKEVAKFRRGDYS